MAAGRWDRADRWPVHRCSVRRIVRREVVEVVEVGADVAFDDCAQLFDQAVQAGFVSADEEQMIPKPGVDAGDFHGDRRSRAMIRILRVIEADGLAERAGVLGRHHGVITG